MSSVVLPFEQLDFLYTPSRDVAADMEYAAGVLGARIVFAIDAMGTRVAMVELAHGPPSILYTDHLDGEAPVLVFRVTDLERTLGELSARGWQRETSFEIPHGPCCSFSTPSGHRFAVYELVRPEAAQHFDGRRDF